MTDYIPRNDAEFSNWLANFISYIAAHLDQLKLTPDDLAALQSKQTGWTTAYADHQAAQTAAESACRHKDDCRKEAESLLRRITQQLQSNPILTDSQRSALGITIRQGQRTRVAVPTTRPVGRVQKSDRFRHVIHFVDEETLNRRAKPEGVFGCEIWVKLGDAPPIDPDKELKFLGTNTSAPFEVSYRGEDAGKTAHYMLRWVNKRGKTGPWSATVSAIIQG